MPRRPWCGWRAAAALFLAALVVHGRSIAGGFVYDDDQYILANPLLADGLTPTSIRAAFTTFHAANWHPLTWLSHLADVALYGFEPAGHHATNVVLHGLNAVVWFTALTALTRRRRASFVVAALFVVHPLRVESVAWVAERKDLLAGLCTGLTLWAWAHYGRRPGVGRYLLAFTAYLAGALAKPTVVSLWCVLLLLDAWPLARLRRERLGVVLLEKLPFVALSAGLAWLTVHAQGSSGAFADPRTFTPAVRVLSALAAYGFYLGRSFWPSDLACFYPHAAMTERDPLHALALPAALGLAALLGLVVLGLVLARRRPGVLVGALFFAGTLVPVLGLVQVGSQAWADRYAYVPLIGVHLALVEILVPLARRVGLRWSAAVVAGACTALGVSSFRQTAYWKDDETLFEHALAVTDRNYIAHVNLGRVYLDRGELERASAHLEAALALVPYHDVARHDRSMLRERRGDLAGAIADEEAVAAQTPRAPQTWRRLGKLEARAGDVPAAERAFARVLGLVPGEPDALYNLGVLAERRGDLAQAEQRYLELLAAHGDSADALVNLGNVRLRTQRPAEALAVLERAAALAPELVAAHVNLALARRATGDAAGAVQSDRTALRLEPENLAALSNLAWILATHPDASVRDGAQAVELARRAHALAPEEVGLLETLAAAYAEAGDLDSAVSWQTRAVDALGERPKALALANSRLEGYRAGRPLRQP